jgi:hypothetical protein
LNLPSALDELAQLGDLGQDTEAGSFVDDSLDAQRGQA